MRDAGMSGCLAPGGPAGDGRGNYQPLSQVADEDSDSRYAGRYVQQKFRRTVEVSIGVVSSNIQSFVDKLGF